MTTDMLDWFENSVTGEIVYAKDKTELHLKTGIPIRKIKYYWFKASPKMWQKTRLKLLNAN